MRNCLLLILMLCIGSVAAAQVQQEEQAGSSVVEIGAVNDSLAKDAGIIPPVSVPEKTLIKSFYLRRHSFSILNPFCGESSEWRC